MANAAAPAPDQSVSVELIGDLAELEDYLPDWEQLASTAAEPNVFFEPWMLLPAIRHFHRQYALRFLLVWGTDSAGERQLHGLFPMMYVGRYRRLPLPVYRLLRYYYCSLCTPLIQRERVMTTLTALLDWFEAAPRTRGLLDLNTIGSDGPVGRTLMRLLAQRPNLLVHSDHFSRALLRRRHRDAESYTQSVFPAGRRRKLRRQERRLGERGHLEYRELAAGDPVDDWIEAFITLEASGWKGATGSALQAKAERRAFFREICHSAHARRRLHMFQLCLDGRPLAQICRFSAQDGMFAFRTAYDEAYAKFSPGLLLSLHHTRRVHENGRPDWIDSCAAPDASLPNQIWLDRRRLMNLRLAAKGGAAAGALEFLALADRLLKQRAC
jgi:CelD/BcsL family acetyltransferase involved in cellulose biosynthesis